MLDEPLERDLDVHVVLGRDRVAAHLTALKLLQAAVVFERKEDETNAKCESSSST